MLQDDLGCTTRYLHGCHDDELASGPITTTLSLHVDLIVLCAYDIIPSRCPGDLGRALKIKG